MTHLISSLKKLGKTFKIQRELLKTETNHDELDGNNYKDKKNKCHMLKMTFSVRHLFMLDIVKLWTNLLDFQ